MPRKTPVINWRPRRNLTAGLRALFRKKGDAVRTFSTVRMGEKWAKKLKPGDKVAISIGPRGRAPKIIGYAEVISVTKKVAALLTAEDLVHNIGAKSPAQAMRDMIGVYGGQPNPYFIVSIVEMDAGR